MAITPTYKSKIMKLLFSICTCFALTIISMDSFSQTKLNHVAYYVKDLEKSGVFYGEILGLEETEEPFKEGRHLWYNLGDNVTLHLIKGLTEDLIFERSNHLCLSVEDLDGFMDNLRSR